MWVPPPLRLIVSPGGGPFSKGIMSMTEPELEKMRLNAQLNIGKKGRSEIKSFWKLIMDSSKNPLSNIDDMSVRHMIMQVLAWMWCIIFSAWMGSIAVFGISAVVHAILLAGVFITFGVFETAKRRPKAFDRFGK